MLAAERAICVVGRCSESSRTGSTFRFLRSVRLASHPARYALEGGVCEYQNQNGHALALCH